MTSFAIELYWPGMTDASIRELVNELKRILAPMDPTFIGFLGCMVAPRDEICFLRVEAEAEWRVAEIAERLALDRPRIWEMTELSID